MISQSIHIQESIFHDEWTCFQHSRWNITKSKEKQDLTIINKFYFSYHSLRKPNISIGWKNISKSGNRSLPFIHNGLSTGKSEAGIQQYVTKCWYTGLRAVSYIKGTMAKPNSGQSRWEWKVSLMHLTKAFFSRTASCHPQNNSWELSSFSKKHFEKDCCRPNI